MHACMHAWSLNGSACFLRSSLSDYESTRRDSQSVQLQPNAVFNIVCYLVIRSPSCSLCHWVPNCFLVPCFRRRKYSESRSSFVLTDIEQTLLAGRGRHVLLRQQWPPWGRDPRSPLLQRRAGPFIWKPLLLLFQQLKTPQILRQIPCLLYTSPSPRDRQKSRMPSSA